MIDANIFFVPYIESPTSQNFLLWKRQKFIAAPIQSLLHYKINPECSSHADFSVHLLYRGLYPVPEKHHIPISGLLELRSLECATSGNQVHFQYPQF